MNYAVRRGLRPRMPPRGRKTGKERRTTRDADGDTLARSRATLLSSFSLASRSFSLLLLLAASTCVCHHLSPPPLPSSLLPSPLRRRLLDAPARITPPTLCSNRLKFSYRYVYRPSLCLEQVKCTATVVAPASTMLFSTFRRHCCAGRVAGRPRRPFLFLRPLEHSSFPPSQWKGSCQLRSFCVEDNRQNRTNVDINENTFCLSTCALNFTDVPCTLCVRYDEESRLFCERTAINSTSFFFAILGKRGDRFMFVWHAPDEWTIESLNISAWLPMIAGENHLRLQPRSIEIFMSACLLFELSDRKLYRYLNFTSFFIPFTFTFPSLSRIF